MRRIEYLLRLSVLVGLRSPPRLSTPAPPSKKRMICFVLIFNFCDTSAGVKYSASADCCSIITAGSGSLGCCRALAAVNQFYGPESSPIPVFTRPNKAGIPRQLQLSVDFEFRGSLLQSLVSTGPIVELRNPPVRDFEFCTSNTPFNPAVHKPESLPAPSESLLRQRNSDLARVTRKMCRHRRAWGPCR
jgi:hypothetical protein